MRAQFDSVRVIGDFNGFRTDTSARPLVRQRDGTYSIDVPVTADSLSYALLKVSVRSSVPSTFDDRVIRSASGSYRSVAIVRGGVAHVVFDPTRLVRDTQPAWAAYGNTRSGDVARINDAIFAHNSRWNEAERAQQSMTAARWAPTVQRSMAALARERAPDVRAARLLELLALSQFGAEVPPAVGSMALRELPPGSPSWHTVPSLAFGLPFVAFRVADRVSHLLRPPPKQVIPTAADSVRLRRYASRYAAWTDSAVARQDNELKIAQLLQFGVAVTNGLLPQRASRYLGQMEAAYPNAASTKFALQVWGGQRVLRKGIAMPAFDVGALADSTKRISNTTLAGKYVLIDFWATWCSPCIGEMPTLHGAYEAFHSRGLELVSVSIDNAPSDVVAFRSARWPMPWQHAWVPGGLFAPALKSLDLYGVPHIVLPGPDGTIIAEQQDLRGVMLARTLDTLLPKSSER
jgi:thiol-disulfide isomerase/thioredoxin